MKHLNLETLARLVDEAPSQEERHHLNECVDCRTELELLQGQTLALGQLPDLRPPKGDWAVLEARLMSEGLVRHERSKLAATPGWMKVAATILLFLGGTGLGMALDGDLAVTGRSGGGSSGPYQVVDSRAPNSLADAEEAVQLAERVYRDALVQYRQLLEREQGLSAGISPERRLAALEYLVAAGQAAVEQLPSDPILNGFLASALAERQATYQAVLQGGAGSSEWF